MLNVDRVGLKLQHVYTGQTSSTRFEVVFRATGDILALNQTLTA